VGCWITAGDWAGGRAAGGREAWVWSTSIAEGLAWDGFGSTSMGVWLHPGEVAAGLGSLWEVLNILEMSLVEARLVRGVLAFAMVPVGAGGKPKAAQSCTTGRLRKEMCALREKG